MRFGYVPSPVGQLLVLRDDTSGALRGLYFPDHTRGPLVDPVWRRDDDAVQDVAEQVGAYFAGHRTTFDLPLELVGTPFQRRVWAALQLIPYGTTTTYAALAASIGAPTATRAVGPAVGRNPISIVVPCHRVVGSSGSLTGFAGGLPAKRALLDLESGDLVLTRRS